MPIPPLDPMLATAGSADSRREWKVESKLDGWRALLYIDSGLRVRTRTGRIVTAAVPELGALVDALPDGPLLDGELVAGQGRASDFYRLGPHLARRHRPPALTFAAFDVLYLAGEPTTQGSNDEWFPARMTAQSGTGRFHHGRSGALEGP